MSRPLRFCFHGVGRPRRPLERGEDRLWLSPAQFAAILDELREHRGVEITFDDGNASDVHHALPLLQDRGLRATFFVIADRIDQAGSLSAHDLRALTAAGMRVGSHGLRHRPWRGLSPSALTDELVVARDRIASASGQQVVDAACPQGAYDRRAISALQRLGYRRVYTSDGLHRAGTDLIHPRYSVTVSDTARTINQRITTPPGGWALAVGGVKQRCKRWR